MRTRTVRPVEPTNRSPGMTSLAVAVAIAKAADLRCEVIWESWDKDAALRGHTHGVQYSILWAEKFIYDFQPT